MSAAIQTAVDTSLPTSLETLVQYRTAHAAGSESRRVWLFHAHVYFDHCAPEQAAKARAFMTCIQQTFAPTADVEVHGFIPFPAGPHPRGSFEVLFTRAMFAEFVSWLMFARPESLDILVHPLTRSQTLDHTGRAFWLGKPLILERTMLDAADARHLATGRTEESIIDTTKTHVAERRKTRSVTVSSTTDGRS